MKELPGCSTKEMPKKLPHENVFGSHTIALLHVLLTLQEAHHTKSGVLVFGVFFFVVVKIAFLHLLIDQSQKQNLSASILFLQPCFT